MGKQKIHDYDHQQIEITGFPKEPKQVPRLSIREKILQGIKKKKRMRYMEIMKMLGHGGYNSLILYDMVEEGILRKKKFDCGTCEYFELVKE